MDLVGTPIDVALMPVTATTSFVRKYYVGGNQSIAQKALMTPLTGVVYLPSCLIITGATTFMRFVSGLVNIPMGSWRSGVIPARHQDLRAYPREARRPRRLPRRLFRRVPLRGFFQ
jgi:hypothetical protein